MMNFLIRTVFVVCLFWNKIGTCTHQEKNIMNKHNQTKFVILAGGSGSRLWPFSSSDKPKQLIPFLDSSTLLEQTIKRITPLITANKDIMVVTHERYKDPIQEVVGKNIGNILTEPLIRNTAPAVLQAVCHLSKDEDPVIAILPSDHFIPDQGHFLALLTKMIDLVAEEPYLAILGAHPTHPATGYGYIQSEPNHAVKEYLKVQQFHEKPNEKTAQQYIDAKNYFWNMGIVVGRCSTFLQEFKEHAPNLLQIVLREGSMEAAYKKLPSISLDVAILEKSNRVVVFPWAYEWYDVGSIQTFLELHKRFAPAQIHQQVIAINAGNNLISSNKKVVACVGVSDICVVETDDALLIVNRKDVESVRSVSEYLDRQKSGA